MNQPPAPHRGRLLIVPMPLDHGCDDLSPIDAVLPRTVIDQAAALDHWVCENAKTLRAVLKRISVLAPLKTPLQAQSVLELPRELHKKGDAGARLDARTVLAGALAGHDTGLASEAGMPGVADPGASVVRAAHELGIEVVPMVGPSALLLALAASGLNGQGHAFVGYLPQEAAERARRIRALQTLAVGQGQTQLFIETPYRNRALWSALLEHLSPTTRLGVASGLTLPQARCITREVQQWRGHDCPVGDAPAVFLIGR